MPSKRTFIGDKILNLMESRMRGNPHVRFGKRVGKNRIEQSMYGVPDSTSRTLKPSLTDITITKQLVICGNFLELPGYDHIILSENGFYSLNDKGFINSVKIKSETLKYR